MIGEGIGFHGEFLDRRSYRAYLQGREISLWSQGLAEGVRPA
jgi:hypothetical protein